VPELKQRLAAILAADAAGYSHLMSLDELATMEGDASFTDCSEFARNSGKGA
jgi:hypothetical protein